MKAGTKKFRSQRPSSRAIIESALNPTVEALHFNDLPTAIRPNPTEPEYKIKLPNKPIFPRSAFRAPRSRIVLVRIYSGLFGPKTYWGDETAGQSLPSINNQPTKTLKPRPLCSTLPPVRAHGMWTYEPRQGRKAATVVCSTSAVVTLAFFIYDRPFATSYIPNLLARA